MEQPVLKNKSKKLWEMKREWKKGKREQTEMKEVTEKARTVERQEGTSSVKERKKKKK